MSTMQSLRGRSASDRVIIALMIVIDIAILYPFYYVLINSFNGMLSYGPSYLVPEQFSIVSYRVLFQTSDVLRAFTISVSRTAAGTVLTVLNTAMCAYALKGRIRFRAIYLAFLVVPNFFRGGIIPRYLNFRSLGLLDNFFVYLLPTMFQFFYFVIFMSAFRDVPDSLEESAKMDGAGYFRIFFQIYLPLSLPIVATIALFAGVYQWNRWFDTVYFTRSDSLQTLSALLLKIVKQGEVQSIMDMDTNIGERNPEGIKFAAMVATILPIVFIYPFLQRYFIKGLTLGSIKG